MTSHRRVCVFCGSSHGKRPAFAAAARAMADTLVDRGLGLVYGGGDVGLMGVIADAVLARGGPVIGVIPESLRDREVAHPGLTELHVVDTMHRRKALMAELSDVAVALPGGLGTLDELFEIMTWNQLGIVDKPTGLLDVDGYFDPLLAFLDSIVDERFARAEHRDALAVDTDPARLLGRLLAD